MNNRASMGGPGDWPLFVMLVGFAIAILLLAEVGLL